MQHAPIILTIDDDPGGRLTLEALLYQEGYQLAFAQSGQEGLVLAASLLPDLILLDVMMPVLDGFSVCRSLRADPRLAQVPIILITALDDKDSRLEGLASGADEFVTKPFDHAELLTRIRTVARLNRYRRILEERERLEWIVDHADEGFLLLDAAGQIRYANPSARRYLDLPPEPAPATGDFLAIASRRYRLQPEIAWATWPDPSNAQHSPRLMVLPAGETHATLWLRVECNGRAPGPDGDRLLRLRDISAEMTLQRDTWSFHATVMHKLRTPLTGLVSGIRLLSRAPSLASDPGASQIADIVLESAGRLQGEIMDILTYIEAPAMLHGDEHMPLADLPQLTAAAAAAANVSRIEVTSHVADSAARLPLSRRAMELILVELLENTRKFHPSAAPTVHLTVDADGRAVRVRLSDDGVSLAPEHIERAWLPYYQAEKWFTGQIHGMGLGLATVAQLVWGAGGSCRLTNRTDGAGVIVELNLPLAPELRRNA
ncbi:MAG: hypothetical protein RLZZ387_490 [Chloroflexota bacterium]